MTLLARCSVLVLLLMLAGVVPSTAAQDAPPSSLRIGHITIVADDVFTPEEAEKGWVYRATNVVHIQTRARVVRQFLLFREGDPYVPERLAESERNLRALSFIRSALVRAGEPHDGVVDVTVETQDSWTLEPGIAVGRSGGTGHFGLDLVESNLFGTGRKLKVAYDKGAERTRETVSLYDPTLFGRYWSGQLLFSSNSDGKEEMFELARPFYSFEAPWAIDVAGARTEKEDHLYRAAVAVTDLRQKHEEVMLSYGRALKASMISAHRLTFGLLFESAVFEHLDGEPTVTPPVDREYRYLFADYELVVNRFLKMNYVNRDHRFEDFNVGLDLRCRLGISPRATGALEDTGYASVYVSKGAALGSQGFIIPHASYETRIGPTNRNATLDFGAILVRRVGEGAHPQTFVSRVSYLDGQDLDPERQFFADGATGLRGYRLHAFAGDSALIINVEHRWFLGRELLQFISPGFALFADAGWAADGGERFDPGRLKTDVGVGLRIGMTRSQSNIFRLDLAYALDEDALGRSGLLVSFSSMQAF